MAKKKAKSKSSKSSSPAVKPPITVTNHDDVIAAALNTVNTPVLIKVCRLCETKDGPFLNIFDADKATAKKIEDLMPFGIAEYDDLPHKICFRCSAKVEELHEFVQKCVRTQKSLHEALGKKAPLLTKNKLRTQWEEKLNKSNISNDDICDALVKKAMEGIKGIPLNPTTLDDDDDIPLKPRRLRGSDVAMANKVETDFKDDNDTDVTLKNLRLAIEKCDNQIKEAESASNTTKPTVGSKPVIETKTNKDVSTTSKENKQKTKRKTIDKSGDSDSNEQEKKVEEPEPVKNDPPFNIMDYVTTIKVNSVGILFQCKLCNRNYLKKEVVENHGCAKTGIPKIDLTVKFRPPEPPKLPNTVKYIKIDNNKRPPINKDKDKDKDKDKEKVEVDKKKDTIETPAEKPKVPPKPKIGPASKVKKYAEETNSDNESQKASSEINKDVSQTSTVNATLPSVSFATNPNLNLLYKLVPGPNNTFTLVSGPAPVSEENEDAAPKAGKKRKATDENTDKRDKKGNSNKSKSKPSNEDIIDLDENETDNVPPVPSYQTAVGQPYPVGLFQTRPHHSATMPLASTSEKPVPTFTTPAMKKQSYTVVQTGNPSKLVISTKSLPSAEEVPKKRPKKNKEENANAAKEPYNVTIEDVTPPKEPGFFTFINVDPLLQPSYVLPTDNIIQESQISTSTPVVVNNAESKEKYTCNMCGEAFSREKKLLTHIQSHYSKMDEEDKLREKSQNKRRGKKS